MLWRVPPIVPHPAPSSSISSYSGAEVSTEDEQGKHKQNCVTYLLNSNICDFTMVYADNHSRCPNCRRVFRVRFRYNWHILKCQQKLPSLDELPTLPPQQQNHIRSEIYESALRECCRSIRFTRTADSEAMLPQEFLMAARPHIHTWLNELQQQTDEYKLQPVLREKWLK